MVITIVIFMNSNGFGDDIANDSNISFGMREISTLKKTITKFGIIGTHLTQGNRLMKNFIQVLQGKVWKSFLKKSPYGVGTIKSRQASKQVSRQTSSD